MRNKKMLISAILITTVMLFAGGCGKQAEPVSAEPAETEKEVGTEESLESTAAPTVEPEEGMENSENEVDITGEDEATVKNPEVDKTEDTAQADTNANATTETAPTAAPVQPTATPAPTTAPAQPEPTTTPEPVHEHIWKEHTATTQVWIPNIVVVDDYEQRIIETWVATCDCGYQTSDPEALRQHIHETYHGYGSQTFVTDEWVWVGSHEEDQGHYETSTYVDYYYCDCGATRN